MAKVNKLREFISKGIGAGSSFLDLSNYLAKDMKLNLREIQRAFKQITFDDNFQGWVEEVTIPASGELEIVNRLGPIVPNYRLFLRGDSEHLADGDSDWDGDHVYLKNSSGSAVTVTVAFFI